MYAVMALVLGASVGSFLNVVADRLPAGRSLIKPRSYCEACERTLSSQDLVPVVSYIWLRGRCRHCGAAIPARLMLVEAVTALLFVATYLRYGMGTEFVVLSVAISLLVVIALIDLEHGLILNRVVFPSIGVLLILAPFWSELGVARSFLGSESLAASVFNSLVAGAGAFLFFLVITLAFPQGMGAGDVKFAGLLGLLVGYPGVLISLWLAVVGGGVVAIVLLALRKMTRKDSIPFGPFLALGATVVLLGGDGLVTQLQELPQRAADLWS